MTLTVNTSNDIHNQSARKHEVHDFDTFITSPRFRRGVINLKAYLLRVIQCRFMMIILTLGGFGVLRMLPVCSSV